MYIYIYSEYVVTLFKNCKCRYTIYMVNKLPWCQFNYMNEGIIRGLKNFLFLEYIVYYWRILATIVHIVNIEKEIFFFFFLKELLI